MTLAPSANTQIANTVVQVFRTNLGTMEVREVPKEHADFPELGRQDKLLAIKFGDTWHHAEAGTTTRLCTEQEQTAYSALPLDYDFAAGITWGVQIMAYDSAAQARVWTFVRPSSGVPYQFDSEELAHRNMSLMYPGLAANEVRVQTMRNTGQ